MKSILLAWALATTALVPRVFGLASPASTDVGFRSESDEDFPDLPHNGDIEFEGPAFVNGDNITFEGTAEQFYKKLLSINPDYDAHFKDIIAAQNAETDAELSEWMSAANQTETDGMMRRDTSDGLSSRDRRHWKQECHRDRRGSGIKAWVDIRRSESTASPDAWSGPSNTPQ
ncbi:hypothetical protein FDECE_8300 [Fusarium decemcellulare]|nr:hypothetical protein FDECE_8300 [Fusarium decemcellulare]